MADSPTLRLKARADHRIKSGHLWVFSNEVDTDQTPLHRFSSGEIVAVQNHRGHHLGTAYVNPHSLITARILTRRRDIVPDSAFLADRIRCALTLRAARYHAPFYRAVYGESDRLPGLVVDRYDDVLVAQISTAGMEALKEEISAALDQVFRPRGILWKNDAPVRELEGLAGYVEVAAGAVPDTLDVLEDGVRFAAPVMTGQKTGWFFDQAANRCAVKAYVRGARVLDVFAYVGAWGLQAAAAGASQVVCVDSSAQALEVLRHNARASGVGVETVQGHAFGVLERLRREGRRFDVVILDPPALIKRRKERGKGRAAYRRLNRLGMALLAHDGLLVSCSCSYHLTHDELMAAIQGAAIRSGRWVQVLERRSQAPDHPVHPAIPETSYLKAFFCRVLDESRA